MRRGKALLSGTPLLATRYAGPGCGSSSTAHGPAGRRRSSPSAASRACRGATDRLAA